MISADELILWESYQSYQSGIETKVYTLGEFGGLLSIVPKWNWNCIFCISANSSPNYQSYQSGIETTYRKSDVVAFCKLSIVPKWNWNIFSQLVRQMDTDYQSYQSGIETRLFYRSVYTAPLYQSYQSGIETRYLIRKSRKSIDYQSYQSGIETYYQWL